jgi:hypothetical protein
MVVLIFPSNSMKQKIKPEDQVKQGRVGMETRGHTAQERKKRLRL